MLIAQEHFGHMSPASAQRSLCAKHQHHQKSLSLSLLDFDFGFGFYFDIDAPRRSIRKGEFVGTRHMALALMALSGLLWW
jgi:hypothetical protein